MFYAKRTPFLSLIILMLLLPLLGKVLFFRLPQSSSTFDCDDSTLAMYQRLASTGIKSTVMAGDLDANGEKFEDIDHVWLVADIAGQKIAFDWGLPELDRQHYEGYAVSYQQLEAWVAHDFEEQIAGLPGKN